MKKRIIIDEVVIIFSSGDVEICLAIMIEHIKKYTVINAMNFIKFYKQLKENCFSCYGVTEQIFLMELNTLLNRKLLYNSDYYILLDKKNCEFKYF